MSLSIEIDKTLFQTNMLLNKLMRKTKVLDAITDLKRFPSPTDLFLELEVLHQNNQKHKKKIRKQLYH